MIFRCGLCHFWSGIANILPSRMDLITRAEGIMHDTYQGNYQALRKHAKSRQHLRVRQFLMSQTFKNLDQIQYPLAVIQNARWYKNPSNEPSPLAVTEAMLRTVYQEVSKINIVLLDNYQKHIFLGKDECTIQSA